MAKITKEQYEKEQSAVKKLVSKDDLELRKRILEKVKRLEEHMQKNPGAAKKRMLGLHKKLVRAEEKIHNMLAPRNFKKLVSESVKKIIKKKKQKTSKKSKKRRKK